MQSAIMEGTAPDPGLYFFGLTVVVLLVLFVAFRKEDKAN